MAISFEADKKAKELALDLRQLYRKSRILVVPSKKVIGGANVWILSDDWSTLTGFSVSPEGDKIKVQGIVDNSEFDGKDAVRQAGKFARTKFNFGK